MCVCVCACACACVCVCVCVCRVILRLALFPLLTSAHHQLPLPAGPNLLPLQMALLVSIACFAFTYFLQEGVQVGWGGAGVGRSSTCGTQAIHLMAHKGAPTGKGWRGARCAAAGERWVPCRRLAAYVVRAARRPQMLRNGPEELKKPWNLLDWTSIGLSSYVIIASFSGEPAASRARVHHYSCIMYGDVYLWRWCPPWLTSAWPV